MGRGILQSRPVPDAVEMINGLIGDWLPVSDHFMETG
jgi:hypothetical protein